MLSAFNREVNSFDSSLPMLGLPRSSLSRAFIIYKASFLLSLTRCLTLAADRTVILSSSDLKMCAISPELFVSPSKRSYIVSRLILQAAAISLIDRIPSSHSSRAFQCLGCNLVAVGLAILLLSLL